MVVSGKAARTLKNWARCDVMPLSSKTPSTEANYAATLADQKAGSFTELFTGAGAVAGSSGAAGSSSSMSKIRGYHFGGCEIHELRE